MVTRVAAPRPLYHTLPPHDTVTRCSRMTQRDSESHLLLRTTYVYARVIHPPTAPRHCLVDDGA